MIRRILLACAWLVTAPLFAGEDYFSEINKLYDAAKYDQALTLACQWEKAEPQNPQAFIEEANGYFNLGYKDAVEISQKTPEEGDLVLTNDKTKAKWTMGQGGSYDPELCHKGIAILEKTVARFPNRFDIWMGLGYIHQKLKEYPSMLDVLDRACAYTSAHPKGLILKDGKKLKGPADQYVPETLQNYCNDFIQSGDPQDSEMFLKISQIMAKYYPHHAYGFDNIGGYYVSLAKWAEAKKYYLIASGLAPEDSMEWMNLGTTYRYTGDKANALKCYQKVIDLNNDARLVDKVKGLISDMNKDK